MQIDKYNAKSLIWWKVMTKMELIIEMTCHYCVEIYLKGCTFITLMAINQCDENKLMWWKHLDVLKLIKYDESSYNKNVSTEWKFIIVILLLKWKFSCVIKLITLMNIYHRDKDSLIWWKCIKKMRYSTSIIWDFFVD